MDQKKLISSLNQLVSEEQNPDTLNIDTQSTIDLVTTINQQDELVALAIKKILPEVALAIDLIVTAFANEGRLIYIGAGTSGRLGVLDAVECVPTFGVADDVVIGVMAGGRDAMFKSQEGIEDSESCGVEDLKTINLTAKDIVVGIAASGRTPYVIGGLKYAQTLGAKTVAISCNPQASISHYSDVSLLPIVGAEVVAGSTRMKSGTAQKMLLNMLSTAAMIRMGKTYQNLMIDVKTSNKKLIARALKMIMQLTHVDQLTATKALDEANDSVKLAILMLKLNVDRAEGERRLILADGFLRLALQADDG